MKQYVYFLLLTICLFTMHKCEKDALEKRHGSLEAERLYNQYLKGQIRVSDPSLRVPKTKIYWQGWLKYFHYDSGRSKKKPHSFFVNNQYFNQLVLNKERGLRDRGGFVHIPTRFHFYARLLKHGLNIIASRQEDHIAHTIDTLSIDLILPVPEDKRYKGGVRDLGNFDEGNCIQVDSKIPAYFSRYFYSGIDKGMNEHWILCTDDANTKTSLLNMLVRLRIFKQKSLGKREKSFTIFGKNGKRRRIRKTITSFKSVRKDKGVERYYGPGHNIKLDGYWILLNDWSQCTLRCGGGFSYQQWMCIPPKKGGKNCVGESIRKKPCNTHACPIGDSGSGSQDEKSLVASATNKVITPVFEMLPFSNRPQRNIRCLIKESDVLFRDYSRPLINNEEAIKVPGRLVMNNSTISLYSDENYSSSIFTFKLTQVMLGQDTTDICCFSIKSNNKKYEICSFSKDCGTVKKPKFFKEWKKDFTIFAQSCYEPMDVGHGKDRLPTARIVKKNPVTKAVSAVMVEGPRALDIDIKVSTSEATKAIPFPELKVDNEIKRAIQSPRQEQKAIAKQAGQAQMKMMEQRSKFLENKLQKTEEKKLEGKIGKTQKTVMRAMKKELQLEEMIKREQTAKLKKTTKALMKKFRYEKKKKACLQKILKQREDEDQKTREKMEIQTEIKKLKAQAIRQVRKKRMDLKAKLQDIKRKVLRKNRMIEQRIQRIRGSMTSELIIANKMGDWRICKAARCNKNKLVDYCNANFVDNYNKNLECRDPENFCYVCCENEYGSMYLPRRDRCYTMCDELSKTDFNGGDWIWYDDITKAKK
jgi:hypothetical protein